jgi:hypothetical protein
MIDVEAAGDHEVFASPAEFVAGATREALRSFRSIQIATVGEGVHVRVFMRWTGRAERQCLNMNSRIGRWQARAGAWEPEVLLDVGGSDSVAVEKAFTAVRAALRRGTRVGSRRHKAFYVILCGGFILVFAAAGFSGIYAVGAQDLPVDPTEDFPTLTGLLLGGSVALLAVFLARWLFPALEVASAGQSRMWRAFKFIGPVVLALIVSGAAKKLWG